MATNIGNFYVSATLPSQDEVKFEALDQVVDAPALAGSVIERGLNKTFDI